MTRNGPLFSFLVLLPISLPFISCSTKSDDTSDVEMFADVLSYYEILEKIEPTSSIEFTAKRSRDFLLNGWSYLEKPHTWAEGPASRFFFYGLQGRAQDDIEMEITCAPLTFPGSPRQSIGIYVNDQHLQTIVLKPSLSNYTVSLPSNVLKARNIVTFKYAYAARPSAHLRNSSDHRNLAVNFSKITFHHLGGRRDFIYKNNENVIIQHPNSMINYYFKLQEGSKAIFTYEVDGDLKPSVKLTFDNGKAEEIILPDKASTFEQNLFRENAVIAKMSLTALSENINNSVRWKSIKIYPAREKGGLIDNKRAKRDEGQRQILHEEKKPDILLYVVDALRSDHLSCYGYSRKTSPYLDAFVGESTFFLHAYSNSSWTRASGASIATGLLPKNHKTMARDSSLPKDLETLSEILRNNGYYTIAFITNGNVGKNFSFDQGFDEFIQLRETKKRESVHVRSSELNMHFFKFLDEFLARDDRKPLFAFIWSSDPHNPYTPEKSVAQKFGIDRYAPVDSRFGLLKKLREGSLLPSESQLRYIETLYDQEVSFNDISFGNLLNRLKQKNIYENSIIIFTADHGEEFRDHGGYGHGMTLYNESINIPLVIKAKKLEKGTVDTKVQLADIFPTILDILDIRLPYKIDGESLCNSGKLGDRFIFAEEQLDSNDVYSILYDDHKLIYNVASYRPPLEKKPVPLYELYDMRTDKPEGNNLAERQPLLSGYLQQMLKGWMTLADDVFKEEEQKVIISPELDRQLRDLGYVR